MQKIKSRTAKLFLFAFLIIYILFSLIFMTLEADHDCPGESCPICAIIRTAQLNITLLSITLICATLSYTFSKNQTKTRRIFIDYFLKTISLVSQKIKMNN